MSIMDIFKNVQKTAPLDTAGAAAVAAEAQAQAAATAAAAAAKLAAETASPLDAHKTLWEPAAKGADAAPLFTTDATKIMEAAGKANFAANIPPELLAAALKGDAASLAQAINHASQQAFGQATVATTKLIEQALEANNKNRNDELPSLVKRSMVSDSMATNPLYQHEATKPLVVALEQQLAAKHPNATAGQITELAQKFIADFAQVARGKEVDTSTKTVSAAKGGEDWTDF